ncbi:hypothetical protein SAQ01S_07480 [Sphingomonas aquatilis NBRC 16722]|uniref:Uncharacterized protein n=1 Tax=Sphingomonas aquatilis TaxID=93063 RepID=A0AAW3TVQ7_9SPHN|nr:hypothetical protein [Sphingomonas aquatilis]MBB3876130.1 hypothetical protein [Sphingomonas aquatilis]GEM70982.1 hypothetical protein SAQ01S_07480 [Sphingomonas aquatilis NBRC 16722]
MIDMQDARDKLADALWWMRGFAAAAEGRGTERDIAAKLSDVHAYLGDVQNGRLRRLGEETAIVLTFAEFERLVDAARVPDAREITSAKQTIEAVLAEYRREDEQARRSRNDQIPF